MRTTIDLPDALYRQIKVRAALQGMPVRALVSELLQRGLMAPEKRPLGKPGRSQPPCIEVHEPFPLNQPPTNAALFELLEDPAQAR